MHISKNVSIKSCHILKKNKNGHFIFWLFFDFFGSDPSKMDQTCKFGEQTSRMAWFLVKHTWKSHLSILIIFFLFQKFVIKEGIKFRIRIDFVVQREIVTGLKYIQKTSRMGVTVDKMKHMVSILQFLCHVLISEFIKLSTVFPHIVSSLE